MLDLAEVQWGTNRVEARFQAGGRIQTFYVEASEAIGRAPDALLALGLLPAMMLGARLRVTGEVSPRLLDSAREIQEVARLMIDGAELVDVDATPGQPRERSGGGVASFASGGVDSFYTLMRHQERITDLIFIVGTDVGLSEQDPLRRQATEMAREVASAMGKNLIMVTTDVRRFSDPLLSYHDYVGSVLAAVALLFQDRFERVLIPSSHSYASLFSYGSHPILDPLWSTERTAIVNDGAEKVRAEKIEALLESELAMRWLRVCVENPSGAYNCGRCEKCLRTLVGFRAVGAEGRCETLPKRVDLRRVGRVRLTDERERAFTRENLRFVERRGEDPELARALRAALRRDAWSVALRSTFFDQAPEPVKDALRAARARLKPKRA